MTSPVRSELEIFRGLGQREDADDLVEFTSRLRRCIHWVLNRMGGGRRLLGEVDELISEARARLEALRHRGFGGGDLAFRSYLYKVVVSVCADASNRMRWTVSLDAPVTLPDGDEQPLGDVVRARIDPDRRADATLEDAESRGRLRDALGRVDERCRGLLSRFYFDEQPISVLARDLGLRENAVEVALTRCRGRLYAAFLGSYVDRAGEAGDGGAEARVAAAAADLSGLLGRVFTAWWSDHRSVLDISKELALSPAETRKLLAAAKRDVWARVAERPR